jgi:hypothetical protein
MINKKELDLEIRLISIEWVIVKLGMSLALMGGLTPAYVKQMRESAREGVLKETFPGMEATMADHVGAEIADRVEALLRRIEILHRKAYAEAHGLEQQDDQA